MRTFLLLWLVPLLACLPGPGVASAQQPAKSEFLAGYMPYAAFDRLRKIPLKVANSRLDVAFAPGRLALSRSELLAWLNRAARAIAIYYGRFPVKRARILIVPVGGKGVRGGQAFGYRGGAIRLLVGEHAGPDDLAQDWKAVHEMIHLATPSLNQQHRWLTEGLAVYIESIARVQAGDLDAAEMWGVLRRDMPQGLPGPDDKGLDHTPTWGRTYWGGAIFCLLADIEIRKRTANRKGLQDAMRAVVEAGGNIEEYWPVLRLLRTGDKATGTAVLATLYEKMRQEPYAPDLDALWRDLGVAESHGRAVLDNSAPLAAIRRAITRAPDTIP